MRAVMVSVSESLLEERRRIGADRRDEMWEGVLHMVAPANGNHQRLNAGVDEVLVVDPETRGPEVFVRRGDRMVLLDAARARLSSIGVDLAAVAGPRLRITWEDGSAEL